MTAAGADMIDFAAQMKRGAFQFDVRFSGNDSVIALFGPSGSGKTTILNLIAGIDRPDAGRIVVKDRVLVDTDKKIHLPRHKRRTALVFQDAQLFPHMTVAQNLGFAKSFAPRGVRRVDLDAVVETLGIAALMQRRPPGLSGGEKQRVALARALLAAPELLLMDEPLASLDDARKQEILALIEHMRDEFDTPILYVTHRPEEVLRLASRVVILDAGKVRATGAPGDLLADIRGGNFSPRRAVSPCS